MDASVFYSQFAKTPPIIKTVFQNLSVGDLNSCAKVCKTWEEIALSVKKRRRALITHCTLFGDNKDSEMVLADHVQNLKCEPQFVLVFIVSSKYRWQKDTKDTTDKTGSSEWNGYNLLSCQTIICTSCDTSYLSSLVKLMKNPKSEDLTAIFFPTFPGLSIDVFRIPRRSYGIFLDISTIPSNTKLILVIYDRNYGSKLYSMEAESFVTKYLTKEDHRIAIGGIKVGSVNFEHDNSISELYGCYMIAFAGENISAASVIIPPHLQTTKSIEAKLKGLVNANLFDGQCIAIAFTCVKRRLCYLKAQGIEYQVFTKLYPSVPLFVVVGEKAIGIDYLSNITKQPNVDSIFHSNSTVFVILSLKN